MSYIAYKAPYLLKIMRDDDPYNPRDEDDHLGNMMCWHKRYKLGDENPFDDGRDMLKNLAKENIPAADVVKRAKAGEFYKIIMERSENDDHWLLTAFYTLGSETWEREVKYQIPVNDEPDISDLILDELTPKELFKLLDGNIVILPLFLYDHSGLTISTSSFGDPFDSGCVGWIYATKLQILAEYGDTSVETMEKAKDRLQSEVEEYDYYLNGQCYGFQLYENGEESDSCWGFLGNFKDVAQEIAASDLPESHRDMIDNLKEVTDSITKDKDFCDYMRDLRV